jgi:CheY-like chemotaxis protein
VFSILVPHGDPAQVRAAERARAAAMLTGCCVLVVEDERAIRAAMSVLLEGWGCQVVAAGSAEEAETLLAHGAPAPDAILADYRLGGAENGAAASAPGRALSERRTRAHLRRHRSRGAEGSGDVAHSDVAQAVAPGALARDAGLDLARAPRGGRRMKLLIVDDHHLIREGLRPILKRLGAWQAGQDLSAASFEAAVEYADRHRDLDLWSWTCACPTSPDSLHCATCRSAIRRCRS